MEPLLWMLLPVAAASGWLTARYTRRRAERAHAHQSPMSRQCFQGINYLLSEQSDKAIELFVNLVEVDEETVETHLVLGSLFRRRGEVDRAIRIHQNIIARPSLSSEQKSNALLQLGIDYLKAGLLDRAENIFLQLVEAGGDKKEVFAHLRRLYELEKEWERAIEMAEYQVKNNDTQLLPIVAHYFCELVELYVRTQRVEKAISAAKQALAKDPDCIRAYIQLGDIYARKSQFKEAIKSFHTALNKDQYFSPLILKRLHGVFQQSGQLDQFPAFIFKHTDYREDAVARFFLVTTYQNLNNEEQLNQLLHEELKREESSPYIVKAYMEMMQKNTSGDIQASFKALVKVLDTRLSSYMACHCTQCGFESNAIFWQCPGCQNWGTVRPYQNPVEYSWLDS